MTTQTTTRPFQRFLNFIIGRFIGRAIFYDVFDESEIKMNSFQLINKIYIYSFESNHQVSYIFFLDVNMGTALSLSLLGPPKGFFLSSISSVLK